MCQSPCHRYRIFIPRRPQSHILTSTSRLVDSATAVQQPATSHQRAASQRRRYKRKNVPEPSSSQMGKHRRKSEPDFSIHDAVNLLFPEATSMLPDAMANALASQQGDPGSISGGFAPGFSRVGIVLDDAVCRRAFLGVFPASPALAFQRNSILGSHSMSCSRMTGTYGSRLESPVATVILHSASTIYKTLLSYIGTSSNCIGVNRTSVTIGWACLRNPRGVKTERKSSSIIAVGFLAAIFRTLVQKSERGLEAGAESSSSFHDISAINHQIRPYIPLTHRTASLRRKASSNSEKTQIPLQALCEAFCRRNVLRGIVFRFGPSVLAARNLGGGGAAAGGRRQRAVLPERVRRDAPAATDAEEDAEEDGRPERRRISRPPQRHAAQPRGSRRCRVCTSHLPPIGEPGSIPAGVAPGFSHVKIAQVDAAARWIFSGIFRSPGLSFPALLHTLLASPLSSLKTWTLKAAQISSLTHSLTRVMSWRGARSTGRNLGQTTHLTFKGRGSQSLWERGEGAGCADLQGFGFGSGQRSRKFGTRATPRPRLLDRRKAGALSSSQKATRSPIEEYVSESEVKIDEALGLTPTGVHKAISPLHARRSTGVSLNSRISRVSSHRVLEDTEAKPASLASNAWGRRSPISARYLARQSAARPIGKLPQRAVTNQTQGRAT
ncbi:hypothetical protein PR048_031703 [Dryococelus australis]|uniref:Uncharacterized protein n=1 Tax=Dryococelus australis TaxID=614101 RepID=A0ABQ9G8N6_9NEOP|nr:hypothetical protein PR048_031703 [Dryococelus australis]